MNGEISSRDQNRFLYQAVDVSFCCKVGHFNMEVYGMDFWSLKWLFDELHFLVLHWHWLHFSASQVDA